ncbi:CPBP family intramembrane glutamic endopeptidase [Nocardioides zeae]
MAAGRRRARRARRHAGAAAAGRARAVRGRPGGQRGRRPRALAGPRRRAARDPGLPHGQPGAADPAGVGRDPAAPRPQATVDHLGPAAHAVGVLPRLHGGVGRRPGREHGDVGGRREHRPRRAARRHRGRRPQRVHVDDPRLPAGGRAADPAAGGGGGVPLPGLPHAGRGGIFSRPAVSRTLAVVVPALLFALAHGAQDPPVFFDRFAFGLAAGVLVILTGGSRQASRCTS